MHRKKRLIIFLLVLLFAIALAGCTAYKFDELMRFKLDIQVEGSGQVKVEPEQEYYTKGEEITVEAIPLSGSIFQEWDGQYQGQEPKATFTLETSAPLIARFNEGDQAYQLEISIAGTGSPAGSVVREPDLETYPSGTEVTLRAEVGDAESQFSHWLGNYGPDVDPNENEITITMNSKKSLVAVFVKAGEKEIIFADPTLEAAVRQAIEKPEGPILMDDVAELYMLDLSETKYTSLEGLGYLTSLTYLDLHQTETIDISPLETLVNLEYLNLDNNQITDIQAVREMENLLELHLATNQVEDLTPLQMLWDNTLQVLDLSNNNVSDIQVLSGLTTLEELYLGKDSSGANGNRVREMTSLAPLSNLRILDLSNNQIDTIEDEDMQQLLNLEILDLSNNELTDIGNLVYIWFTNLREIYLNGNQIADILVLYGLQNAEIIDVSDNLIVDLAVFSSMSNIRELYLGNNLIEDITNLRNLQMLETLQLHNNRIIEIDVLLNLVALQEVTLMDNAPLNLDDPDSPARGIVKELRDNGVTVKI